MKLGWLTDIHLNFLDDNTTHVFGAALAGADADAFVITGDIGEAPNVARYLNLLDNHLHKPIYFVLGNHDFYRGNMAGVGTQIGALCAACPNLHWMTDAAVLTLTDTTCIVGHDGWADGRFGDYFGSNVFLNDWLLIEDLAGLDQHARLRKLQSLGDEAAAHFKAVLPDAVRRFRHVVVATHVPPFWQACWYAGKISDDNWLPNMSCKAVGEALQAAMAVHPDRHMTVLCGHTHGQGETQILPNLKVLTGGAAYGRPRLQRILAIE